MIKGLTVLYVEDEHDVMEEIVDMLSIKVKKLFTASNGKEALDIFEKEDIDIIITDIQMPVMDGMEFIARVRESNHDVPIIITTAFNEIEYLKQSIDLNVDKYITKPIDMVQLLNVSNRAAKVVIQKKEIEQRDMVIQNMLDMKPYYSILVDINNLQKINNEIFRNLGFDESDELEIKFQTKKDACGKLKNTYDLIEKILLLKDNPTLDETVCLEKRDSSDKRYLLKPYFFTGTNLFMLSFFEGSCVDPKSELAKCYSCLNNKYKTKSKEWHIEKI